MTSTQKTPEESQDFSSKLNPDQALGLVSLSLMQKLANKGVSDFKWLAEENNDKADLQSLRQRLELISLAIETGAPLTTSEVSQLIGVRPNSPKIERGGLVAKRISRNVWKLTRAEKESSYWRN